MKRNKFRKRFIRRFTTELNFSVKFFGLFSVWTNNRNTIVNGERGKKKKKSNGYDTQTQKGELEVSNE